MLVEGVTVTQEWHSDTRSSAFTTRINAHRVTHTPQLSPLAHDQRLLGVAVNRAHRMIEEKFYGHLDLQGRTTYSDLVAAGLNWGTYWESWGENVNWGTGEAEKAYQEFIKSAEHKANIESVEYTHQAAAFVFDPIGGYYRCTWDPPGAPLHPFGPNWFIVHLFLEKWKGA